MEYKIKEKIVDAICYELQDCEGDHDNVEVSKLLIKRFYQNDSNPDDGGITQVWLHDGWGSNFPFHIENKHFEGIV